MREVIYPAEELVALQERLLPEASHWDTATKYFGHVTGQGHVLMLAHQPET
jgi:hypothetical protein